MKNAIGGLLLAIAVLLTACKGDDKKEDPQPQGQLTISAQFEGLKVQFEAQTSGPAVDSVAWDFGDGTRDAGLNPVHTYARSGSYAVVAVAHFGSQRDTARQTITVTEELGGTLSIERLHPDVFRFRAQVLGNPTAYAWDFGDGKRSTEVQPEHAYEATGRFTVRLVLTYASGDTAAASTEVEVSELSWELVRLTVPQGDMLIWLHPQTPLHRANFLKLSREGFYDGTSFHRIVRGFVNQGGDPLSRNDPNGAGGSGGPGYVIPAEIVPTLRHVQGAVAAARTGDAVNPRRNSSGSQFYISAPKAGTPQLDGAYTVFGQVIDGLVVVEALNEVPVTTGDRPDPPVRMQARVERYTATQLREQFNFTP